ncbi:hypothetical protein L211DRAFT_836267 [Terfezia boudieri ATCC MYA-4762]|uniref:Uncharacterized protein n=1 Tax=Terfezia boudieri ATCC MYA-4762 TaxID=1051890 RepID=A0A3N4LWJ0_9PEZI|nr:hypothetical protein L211DRAFT_836267 [Terfezia boudieri ATCC MYA-4762]
MHLLPLLLRCRSLLCLLHFTANTSTARISGIIRIAGARFAITDWCRLLLLLFLFLIVRDINNGLLPGYGCFFAGLFSRTAFFSSHGCGTTLPFIV